MADNTTKNDTDAGNSQNMDDTRTRKTLKLKPVNKPAIDPLTMRNTDTGPLGTMDDTRTRQTVKLKPSQKSGANQEAAPKIDLKPVVDPLTQRNTETGPLGAMVDTRTRKTVKLKPLKTAKAAGAPVPAPAGADAAGKAPEGEAKAEGTAAQTYKDTNTRKTLKLKPVTPTEKKPVTLTGNKPGLKLGESTTKGFKDTNTRKTLKLRPVGGNAQKPGLAANTVSSASTPPPAPEKTPEKAEEKPEEKAVAQEEFDDTRTRKTITKTPAKKTIQLTPPGQAKTTEAKEPEASVAEEAPSDDTIKIKRPEKKPEAMPMPSLGAPAAAKAVSNKDTVKLRPPSLAAKPAGAGTPAEAKASKETIKLSPKPAAIEKEPGTEKPVEEKSAVDQASTINLKLKTKLSVGKPPPPKTPPKEEAAPPTPEAPETPEVSTAPGSGGLKLKAMAPKTEAPRAKADQEKIKGIKKGSPKGKSQASPVYTLVAIIAVVLIAFSALVTAAQYFNLWNQAVIGGQPIEIPVLKDMVK